MTKTDGEWKAIADKIKTEMAKQSPPIFIGDVMRWFGLKSPNTARYYLVRLQKYEYVENRDGHWYWKGK